VLRAMGQFVHERHEGRSLPLWGEPPSRSAVASAKLASEPWFDVDDDGACTAADRYRDVDGNGTFSKDLYFTDVDRDGMRRPATAFTKARHTAEARPAAEARCRQAASGRR